MVRQQDDLVLGQSLDAVVLILLNSSLFCGRRRPLGNVGGNEVDFGNRLGGLSTGLRPLRLLNAISVGLGGAEVGCLVSSLLCPSF